MTKVKVTRVACNTSTGTQDITISGLGTPKAAILKVTKAVTDETLADDAVFGWGVTDGTNHRAWSSHSEDNTGSVTRNQRGMTDECIVINGASGIIDGEANFDSWITDGIRINWGNAPAAGYLLTVTLFTGDISVNVREITVDPASLGTTVSDTTCGFEPDVIFFGGMGFIEFDDGNEGSFQPILGLAANESGGIKQGLMGATEGSGTTSNTVVMHSNKYCTAAFFTSGTYAIAGELTSFNSDGFTLTTREDTVIDGPVAFLAIKFDDGSEFSLDFIDSATSAPGNHDVTAPGFPPTFVYQLVSNITAEESTDTSGVEASSVGISEFDGTNEYCSMVSLEDNLGDTNTKSISSDKAIKVIDSQGTVTHEGTFTSFLSNGWRINYSTANGTARKWIALSLRTLDFVPRMISY